MSVTEPTIILSSFLLQGFGIYIILWEYHHRIWSASKARVTPAQWACYNSSKAGIDNITLTIAIEQSMEEHPVRYIFLPRAVARHLIFVADNLVAHMTDPEFRKLLFVSLGDAAK